MAKRIIEVYAKHAQHMEYIMAFLDGIEQVIGLKNSVINAAINHRIKKFLEYITLTKT